MNPRSVESNQISNKSSKNFQKEVNGKTKPEILEGNVENLDPNSSQTSTVDELASLVPSRENIVSHQEEPLKLSIPLKRPTTPPKLSMSDSGFENLTLAEKLNDPKYREQVYRAYPSEPTCACPILDCAMAGSASTACPSGCTGRCCSSLRKPQAPRKRFSTDAKKDPTYLETTHTKRSTCVCDNDNYRPVSRLRGGGDEGDSSLWRRDRFNVWNYHFPMNNPNNDFNYKNCTEGREPNGLSTGDRGNAENPSNHNWRRVDANHSFVDKDFLNRNDNSPWFDHKFYCTRNSYSGKETKRKCLKKLNCNFTSTYWKNDNRMSPDSTEIDNTFNFFIRENQNWGTIDPSLPGNTPIFSYGNSSDENSAFSPVWYHETTKGPLNATNLCATRLGGGGFDDPPNFLCRQNVTTCCSRRMNSNMINVRANKNINALVPREEERMREGCCLERQMLHGNVRKQDKANCIKKPCLGTDCLIRAFNEAQEFVDSLGKVPGLVGLGLMDPSESPYFRGDKREKEEIVIEKDLPKTPLSQKLPYTSCGGTCKPLTHSAIANRYGYQPTYAAQLSRKYEGIIREGTPPVEPWRMKKGDFKEDPEPVDAELGPCGEPGCKSRRKKPATENLEPSAGTIPKEETVSQHRKLRQREEKRLKSKSRERKATKRIARFIYTAGDTYPGLSYGHANCRDQRRRVPSNMGWLWTEYVPLGKLKIRQGWKPGALSQHMREVIEDSKTTFMIQNKYRPRSAPSRTKRKGKMRKAVSAANVKRSVVKFVDETRDEEEEPPPTLHINRKDGVYYVTMYPIKQEDMEVPQLQEPMKPLQFKITKNKDDTSGATSSTASDMEIEFSPPAAVNRYRKKPDVIHVDTQVKQQEILDAVKGTDGKKKEKKSKKEKKMKK